MGKESMLHGGGMRYTECSCSNINIAIVGIKKIIITMNYITFLYTNHKSIRKVLRRV